MAVMMKKIKRLSTKSSIGARSMPWDELACAPVRVLNGPPGPDYYAL
jgi:hypothetical protein